MTDRIWTDLPRLTPSSVSDLECPKKFKHLRMGDGSFWGSNNRGITNYSARGSAAHEVLRQIYRTRRGDQVNMDNIEALAKIAVWRGKVGENTDREDETQHVIAAVRAVVDADTEEEIAGTISVERPIEFDYNHDGQPLMTVSSKIDRLLVRPDDATTLRLRDYKFTGRPKILLPEAFIYLWTAKTAFRGHGYDRYVIEYEFVNADNQVTRETVTGADVRGQFALVTEAAVRVIRGNEFPAVVGEACTYCPLRSTCQALLTESGHTGDEVF
jgi:hypothetical protein